MARNGTIAERETHAHSATTPQPVRDCRIVADQDFQLCCFAALGQKTVVHPVSRTLHFTQAQGERRKALWTTCFRSPCGLQQKIGSCPENFLATKLCSEGKRATLSLFRRPTVSSHHPHLNTTPQLSSLKSKALCQLGVRRFSTASHEARQDGRLGVIALIVTLGKASMADTYTSEVQRCRTSLCITRTHARELAMLSALRHAQVSLPRL